MTDTVDLETNLFLIKNSLFILYDFWLVISYTHIIGRTERNFSQLRYFNYLGKVYFISTLRYIYYIDIKHFGIIK